MGKIVKLCFGLVFLAIAIQGDENEVLKKRLFQMAEDKESIHGKLKPLKNGLLGEGGFGLVFKGKMIWSKTIVAMKFIKMEIFAEAQQEYEMYSYLNAVDNPDIERFGIPNVYYYNIWDGYMITAFSFFGDGDLINGYFKGYFTETVEHRYINSLILFREFVRQSKYMHSRGVRHDDIKPDNIMLRKHRSFLIDFNSSSKMKEDMGGGSLDYTAQKCRKVIRNALADWESFLYTMCRLNSVTLEWVDNPLVSRLPHLESQLQLAGQMKNKTGKLIANIEKTIKSEPLQRVFLKFANEAFHPVNKFPDYDGMYDAINAELGTLPEVWFTWLTPAQIAEAKRELIEKPLPDIRKDIADPKKIHFVYEKPNITRFYN